MISTVARSFVPRLDAPKRGLKLRATFLLFALTLAEGLSAAETGKLAPTLQPFVDSGLMAGAVALVATPDKVLSVDTVGYSDLAAKKPMRADAVFWIASQSKPITAAALMMLVDEKKVNVDDPVAKYLPELADQWLKAEADGDHQLWKRPRRPVLVRDLLTHTSGFSPKSAIEEPTNDILPLATRVRSYAMMPLNSEPGTKYVYSNAGINTVGRIVEVVSGMPYGKFLEERLFRPLGMKDTTFWPSGPQLERLAKAYEPAGGMLKERPIEQLKYPLDGRDRTAFPGGGLFSTAQDLLKFYRMLVGFGLFEGQRILSPDAVRQMTSIQTP
ncbi:MAG: serine hydrolase domain-containing protein, partial [Verrucomicrobiota bacterium]